MILLRRKSLCLTIGWSQLQEMLIQSMLYELVYYLLQNMKLWSMDLSIYYNITVHLCKDLTSINST